MIEVEHLVKRYGTFAAVSDISFKAEAGEILGFLGPNGAGKTTTMRILTGYMPLTSGKAKVAGFDVMEHSIDVRRNVGYLPETVPLYPDMSVKGYVTYIAQLRGIQQPASRVEDVLKTVGMYDRRDSMIRNISKGMRQRVGLAQALVHDPPVLILDEPTIGLDPLQTLEVRDLVKDLRQSRTVMFSTHILSEAEQVCDRVAIINRGQIVAVDSPTVLRDRLQHGTRLFVRLSSKDGKDKDANAARKAISNVAGVATVEPFGDGFAVTSSPTVDVRARLASTLISAGWNLLELRPLAMSLEDIFIELTTQQEQGKEGDKAERSQSRA